MGTPIGLDWGAVIEVGKARSIDVGLLAEVLPDAERAVLAAISEPSGNEGSGDGQ